MRVLSTVLFLALLASATRAAEPAVRDGLLLRVDAAAQGTRSQQPVDTAVDTSPRGLRGFQLAVERRPTLVSDGQAAYFKFEDRKHV